MLEINFYTLFLLDQIALVNEYVVLYKSSNDVTICLIGRSEDSNELLLYTAVETIHDALIEIIKYRNSVVFISKLLNY